MLLAGTSRRDAAWAEADALLRRAYVLVRPLAAATPRNAASERARLVAAALRGEATMPRWTYAPQGLGPLRAALGALRAHLEREGSPLAALYAARCEELDLEASVVEAVGSAALAARARRRWPPPDVAADRLAERWSRGAATSHRELGARSDDATDPRSLLSSMRARVAALGLPFEVRPHAALSALAATGDRTILVATGRRPPPRTVRRVVLHEVEGHAAPRARAARERSALFFVGTAGGHDDQEGLALVLETRARLLDAERKHDLAARHRAARAMRDGGTFVDVTRLLSRDMGLSAERAVVAAERVFRGSDGAAPGLGREHVYIASYLRVRAALAARPELEALLRRGQIAVDACTTLAAATR
jgi:hypothetical protein